MVQPSSIKAIQESRARLDSGNMHSGAGRCVLATVSYAGDINECSRRGQVKSQVNCTCRIISSSVNSGDSNLNKGGGRRQERGAKRRRRSHSACSSNCPAKSIGKSTRGAWLCVSMSAQFWRRPLCSPSSHPFFSARIAFFFAWSFSKISFLHAKITLGPLWQVR